MDERGQTAFEYLLTALFGILLAIAAALLINAIVSVATKAQADILTYRSETITSLMQ
ncbi:MAG: hypothetical protein HY394_06185 [Candidatus Diapherotrites archaeon]|nr:hypothetical protein [Candidatus Diapherotrites archaeon]